MSDSQWYPALFGWRIKETSIIFFLWFLYKVFCAFVLQNLWRKISELNTFENGKITYLSHFCSCKGLKSSVLYLASSSHWRLNWNYKNNPFRSHWTVNIFYVTIILYYCHIILHVYKYSYGASILRETFNY